MVNLMGGLLVQPPPKRISDQLIFDTLSELLSDKIRAPFNIQLQRNDY